MKLTGHEGVSAFVVILLVVAAVTPAHSLEPDSESAIGLRWALGAVEPGGDRPVAVRNDTALNGGTRLKFLIEPVSSASVYLLLLDSKERIRILYRQSVSGGGDRMYLPEGENWFRLDEEGGRDTFFILASSEPLADLDRLLSAYQEAGAGNRQELSGAIVGEVRRLQKSHRNFARPVEIPTVIGGRTRGAESPEEAIDRLAVEISAEQFYAKTITIDH